MPCKKERTNEEQKNMSKKRKEKASIINPSNSHPISSKETSPQSGRQQNKKEEKG
jgi:hypothetical protein